MNHCWRNRCNLRCNSNLSENRKTQSNRGHGPKYWYIDSWWTKRRAMIVVAFSKTARFLVRMWLRIRTLINLQRCVSTRRKMNGTGRYKTPYYNSQQTKMRSIRCHPSPSHQPCECLHSIEILTIGIPSRQMKILWKGSEWRVFAGVTTPDGNNHRSGIGVYKPRYSVTDTVTSSLQHSHALLGEGINVHGADNFSLPTNYGLLMGHGVHVSSTQPNRGRASLNMTAYTLIISDRPYLCNRDTCRT